MNRALKSNSLVESIASEKQEAHTNGLKELFTSMNLEVTTYAEAERRAAAKPKWCDCDPIVNGKTGRICRTHLFEAYRKTLKNEESK